MSDERIGRGNRGAGDAVHAASRDVTIVVVAHRLSTLAICDEIIGLDDGRLVPTRTDKGADRSGAPILND